MKSDGDAFVVGLVIAGKVAEVDQPHALAQAGGRQPGVVGHVGCEAQAHALDVLGGVERLAGVGRRRLQAHVERAEVAELDPLPRKQQLHDAVLERVEHARDVGLGERRAVLGYVLGQPVEVNRARGLRPGVPLPLLRRVLPVVLVELERYARSQMFC